MKSSFVSRLRQEKVLCIAALCALVTMFLVPPDRSYPGYIDLQVLCLLLCLMAVCPASSAAGPFNV